MGGDALLEDADDGERNAADGDVLVDGGLFAAEEHNRQRLVELRYLGV